MVANDDRNRDGDFILRSTEQIANLFIRKSKLHTEDRVYPVFGLKDLDEEAIVYMRQRHKKEFRYTPLYSNGKEPQIEEQDVYRITIPLDSESLTVDTTEKTTEKILSYIRQTPDITNEKLAQLCNMTVDGVYYHTQNSGKPGCWNVSVAGSKAIGK